jgi:FO synthase subunit 2
MPHALDPILNRALDGVDVSPDEGLALLRTSDPDAIAAIQSTADRIAAAPSRAIP